MTAAEPPPPVDPGAREKRRLLLAGGAVAHRVAHLDLALYRVLRGLPLSPEQLKALQTFSHGGEHAAGWLALGAAGAALDHRNRSAWLKAMRTIGIAYVANVGLKNVFRRKRPLLQDLPQLAKTPTALSFPSSHATSSFCAARVYSPMLPAGPLYTAAAAMALSRVVLGVHYPTDIAAGGVIGTVLGGLGR